MSARGFTVEKRLSAKGLNGFSGPKGSSGITLPDAVRTVLSAISDDLRHAPRDCLRDPAELVFWLGNMARRIDAAAEMAVQVASPPVPRSRVRSTPLRAATAREVAAGVFDRAPKAGRKPVETRTVTSRKGRVVRVETRRRSPPGQFELWS